MLKIRFYLVIFFFSFFSNFHVLASQNKVLDQESIFEEKAKKCISFQTSGSYKKNEDLSIDKEENYWQEVCENAIKIGEDFFPENKLLAVANEAMGYMIEDRNFKSSFEEKENMLLAEDYFLRASKIYESLARKNFQNHRIGWLLQIRYLNRYIASIFVNHDKKKSIKYINEALDLNDVIELSSLRGGVQYNPFYDKNKKPYGYKDKNKKYNFEDKVYLALIYRKYEDLVKAKDIYDDLLPYNNCNQFELWGTCLYKLGVKSEIYYDLGFEDESFKIANYIQNEIENYGFNDKNSVNYNLRRYCALLSLGMRAKVEKSFQKYYLNCENYAQQTPRDLEEMAIQYAKKSKLKEAYNYVLKANKILRKSHSDENIKVIKNWLLLAQIVLNMGDYKFASEIYRLQFYYIYKNNYPITSELAFYKQLYFSSLIGQAEKPAEIIDSLFIMRSLIDDHKKSLMYNASRLPLDKRLNLLQDDYILDVEDFIYSIKGNYEKWDLNKNFDESLLMTEKVISELNKLSLYSRINKKGLLERIEKNQFEEVTQNDRYKLVNKNLINLYNRLLNLENKPKEFGNISDEITKLESKLYSFLPIYEEPNVSVDEFLEALPEEVILVDFKKYTPYEKLKNGYGYGDSRYSALISHKGKVVDVDIGKSKVLDDDINLFLKRIEEGEDYKFILENISKKFFNPLRKYLNKNSQIYISLDSHLNYIPINLLKDNKDGSFLYKEFDLMLVSSASELFSIIFENRKNNPNKAIVFANPTFNKINLNNLNNFQDIQINENLRSGKDCQTLWTQLPSTQNEGEKIQKILNAKLFTKNDASETNLKNLNFPPSILHIASHGFYCPTNNSFDSPLLQSGIVLAGANNRTNKLTDNGYFTALEFSRIDLSNTELVVLSSCESALGKDEIGEGLMGLRRSLSVAGAKSSILSLWKVDDNATAKFMELFYEKLKRGESRKKALEQTQEEFRSGLVKSKLPGIDWSEEYYWGAFQLSGDWRAFQFNQ